MSRFTIALDPEQQFDELQTSSKTYVDMTQSGRPCCGLTKWRTVHGWGGLLSIERL